MSYFVSYILDDQDEPEDGPGIASGLGWLTWSHWAESLAKDAPAVANLALTGEADPIEDVEDQLRGLIGKAPDADSDGVTKTLWKAIRDRPANCIGALVTSGEEGGNEGDEGE
jgi:hypothetical protein